MANAESKETSIDDGGPAFPCEGGDMSGLHASYGMSLRDYFAGQALIGLSNNPDRTCAQDAEVAYALADAMIAKASAARS